MAEVLKPDDVLLEFDAVKISNDGSIPFRKGERISFTYLISQKFVGDDCGLVILRDGEKLQVVPGRLATHSSTGQNQKEKATVLLHRCGVGVYSSL